MSRQNGGENGPYHLDFIRGNRDVYHAGSEAARPAAARTVNREKFLASFSAQSG
jgi:hypothetical protein